MAHQTVKKLKKASHLKDLFLLFAIPLGIAIFATVAVYAPRLFAHPEYDFIYSLCSTNNCDYNFAVDNSEHISQTNTRGNYDYGVATLHYYNAKEDSTRLLTLEEAKQYQLNSSSKSPDGYTLSREENDKGLLFWGNYTSDWYLKNGLKKKKVELSTNTSYYSRDITFLGWIKK